MIFNSLTKESFASVQVCGMTDLKEVNEIFDKYLMVLFLLLHEHVAIFGTE